MCAVVWFGWRWEALRLLRFFAGILHNTFIKSLYSILGETRSIKCYLTIKGLLPLYYVIYACILYYIVYGHCCLGLGMGTMAGDI